MFPPPNIFYASDVGASPFWKGVLWVAEAAKMGYLWKIGNGRKKRFWEDQLFGSSSLAIQYWEVYIFVNEKTTTIADIWDGAQLKVIFCRYFDHAMLVSWYEILQITQTIQFMDEEDSLVWKFESKGIYSVSSHYAILNFCGVTPIYVQAVWKIKVPQKFIYSCGLYHTIKFSLEIM